MGSRTADFGGLKQAVFELIDQRATGTLFVATAENHAAQLVLFKGQLQGIAYAGVYNQAAVNQLAALGQLRFSFTPELIYPVAETLLPEQAELLLHQLGYREPKPPVPAGPAAPADSEPTAEQPRQTLRVYRGRVMVG